MAWIAKPAFIPKAFGIVLSLGCLEAIALGAAPIPAPAVEDTEAAPAAAATVDPAGPAPEHHEVAKSAAVEVIQERYPNRSVKVERQVTQDTDGNYINHGAWTMWDEK